MLFQVFHILAAFFEPEPMTVATNMLATKTVKCNSVNAMFPRLIYADICSSFGCFFLCGSGQSTRSPPHPQNSPRYHGRTLNSVTSLFQRCSGPAKESTGACMHVRARRWERGQFKHDSCPNAQPYTTANDTHQYTSSTAPERERRSR